MRGTQIFQGWKGTIGSTGLFVRLDDFLEWLLPTLDYRSVNTCRGNEAKGVLT